MKVLTSCLPFSQFLNKNQVFSRIYISVLLTIAVSMGHNEVCGQRLDHVQGRVLVQLREDIKAEGVISKYILSPRDKENSVKIAKIKNAPMNLVVVDFDYTVVDENKLIQNLRNDQYVLHAQYDKIIQARLRPNDERYDSQWQFLNIGMNGGKTGADINAEPAWDIATGGVTATGDTIVVCIIDDGLDAEHQDMVDNVWYNRDEIPGDGIDNDGNGYIDDYRGWNFRNNNNNITEGGSHGTPVAGIVGAKGNNTIGVTGVNWDVKLMILKYKENITESTVLEAYSYAYDKRKTYNETNGEKGAFVVTTNASWGIDGGNPDDSPIWCEFYNAMGEIGILSCGATANRNSDIDDVGDLPTACDSKYLISVTNLNRNDIKVNAAGFGRETIDIGAHGEDAFTVSRNDRYNGFGGTSGATPHITGAVALTYSTPCTELMNIVNGSPDIGALLVKELILDNATQIPSIEKTCTSGGKLNLGEALMASTKLCANEGLNYAFDLSSTAVGKATLTWSSNKAGTKTDIRYREFSETSWTEIKNVSTNHVISDLLLCAKYEYQIKQYTVGSTGKYGHSRYFVTEGCCVLSEIDSISISDGKITFKFSNENPNNINLLNYRRYGSQNWLTLLGKDSIVIDNFNDCDLLEYRLKTNCPLYMNESLETDLGFLSGDCGECTELNYCSAINFVNRDEWIEKISIDGSEFVTGQGLVPTSRILGGYVPTLKLEKIHYFELTPEYLDNKYDEYWKVYIDLNQNGEFDSDELLISTNTPSNETVRDSIIIPENAELGLTRMRVIMLFISNIDPCGRSEITFGEVEDYCVEITDRSEVINESIASQIKVYPNITSDKFNIYSNNDNRYLDITVYDLGGKQILREELKGAKTVVNCQNWMKGTYIIKVNDGHNTSTHKLIKI